MKNKRLRGVEILTCVMVLEQLSALFRSFAFALDDKIDALDDKKKIKNENK